MARTEHADDRESSGPLKPGAKSRQRASAGSAQLSLFDAEVELIREPVTRSSAPPVQSPMQTPGRISVQQGPVVRRRAGRTLGAVTARVLGVEDMPTYPDEAHDSIAVALTLLPKEQLWFTYKDIQFFFRVSRATVARRLRDGLVPGVRMAGASVIEDSPVRRFDRDQLRWLLLALRHRPRRQ